MGDAANKELDGKLSGKIIICVGVCGDYLDRILARKDSFEDCGLIDLFL